MFASFYRSVPEGCNSIDLLLFRRIVADPVAAKIAVRIPDLAVDHQGDALCALCPDPNPVAFDRLEHLRRKGEVYFTVVQIAVWLHNVDNAGHTAAAVSFFPLEADVQHVKACVPESDPRYGQAVLFIGSAVPEFCFLAVRHIQNGRAKAPHVLRVDCDVLAALHPGIEANGRPLFLTVIRCRRCEDHQQGGQRQQPQAAFPDPHPHTFLPFFAKMWACAFICVKIQLLQVYDGCFIPSRNQNCLFVTICMY